MTKLSILWSIDLQPEFGMQHGATLRWLHLSRELVALGHTVCLSVNQEGADDPGKRNFLENCRRKGWITSWMETTYGFSRRRGRMAHLLAHPTLTNRVLRGPQETTTAAVATAIAERNVDVLVLSQRKLFFLAARLRGRVPVVLDWMDSLTLYEWRHAKHHVRARAFRRLPATVKRLAQALLQERYYGRRSSANVVVSPVDRAVVDRLFGRPSAGFLLLNGVDATPLPSKIEKVEGRLIFSGAMDVPPNYEAAVWFIDHVLPLVMRERPEVTFVVAGRDPNPELLKRAGPRVRVTGEVPDIRREIAKSALYVAPLVSGGGFKNKVVEAIAAGTFVVGTSMAFEFLPRDFRARLLTGDSPAELADRILTVLRHPAVYETRLGGLMSTLRQEYSWRQRADELASLLAGLGGVVAR